MADTAPPSFAPFPSPAVLRALSDRMRDGMLLFNDRGEVALANDVVRELFGAQPGDVAGLARRLVDLLPAAALGQARESGCWSGSLPLGARAVIVHLYHHEHQGEHACLALFRHIDDQEDYENELQRRHAELRQAYLRLNGAQEKLLQSEKMASIGQLAAGVAHEINNPIG